MNERIDIINFSNPTIKDIYKNTVNFDPSTGYCQKKWNKFTMTSLDVGNEVLGIERKSQSSKFKDPQIEELSQKN